VAFLQASDIVDLAMQVEQSGEAFYRAVAKKAQSGRRTVSEDARALFEELADQEVIHYEVFSKLSRTVRDTPLMTDDEWAMYVDYLDATVQSAFFQGPDKALALAETVSDEKEAIHMAMGFEKETLLFFYELRDKISEANRPFVDKIVEEEKKHIRRLAGMLQK